MNEYDSITINHSRNDSVAIFSKRLNIEFNQYNLTAIPESIWHYTSTNGLIGILSDHKLRATHIHFLNDPTEGNVAFDSFKQNLASSLLDANEAIQRDVSNVFEMFLGKTYVTSFTGDSNSLQLWSYYGQSDGYNLGLTTSSPRDFEDSIKLCSPAEPDKTTKLLLPVIYDIDIQAKMVDFFISNIKDLLFAWEKHKSDYDELASNQNPFMFAFVDMLQQSYSYLSCFKSYHHKHENEFRLVIIPATGNDFEKFTGRSGIICPYIEYNFLPDFPLSTITLGPKISDAIAESGLKKILKAKKWNGVSIASSQIKIRF